MTETKRQPRGVEALIGLAYDSALEPEMWPEYLEAHREVFNTPVVHLFAEDLERRSAPLSLNVGLDPKCTKEYYEYYLFLDPGWIAKKDRPVGTVTAWNLDLSESDYTEKEYYRDFARRFGYFYQMGGTIFRDSEFVALIGMIWPKTSPAFTPGDVRRMSRVMPHLQRAFQIARHANELSAARDATGALLDRLPVGVILLDAAGKVVRVNRVAQAIVDAGDGVGLRKERVYLGHPRAARRFARLVRDAVATANGGHGSGGGALAVPRPSAADPYEVLVTPLKTDVVDLGFGHRRPCAAVFLQQAGLSPALDPGALTELFGLTPAEARVAAALAAGQTPAQIAEAAGTSPLTVRTQIKAIHEKLGVHRQAELVQRLLSSPAVLTRPADE